jgi:hypothetical protein
VGWIHYVLNVLALCLPFLFPNIKKQAFIALLLILPPLLSLCFYLIYPHIFAYAGLWGSSWSICILCNRQFKRKARTKFCLIVLLCILGKITWEHFWSLQTEQLIGHPVLIQAFAWGDFWKYLCHFELNFSINVMK